MTFQHFTEYLAKLELTSSRLTMTAVLAELWRELTPTETRITAYLLQGVLLPSYVSLEFQLSTKMVLRALGRLQPDLPTEPAQGLFGADDYAATQSEQASALMLKRYKQLGDIGLTAEQVAITALKSQSGSTQQPHTIEQVYAALVKIARLGGSGSQEQKIEQLVQLLKLSSPQEAKYIARIIIGKLRLGFSTMTLMDSLSWAKHESKVDSEMLEMAYQQKADIGKLAESYLHHDFSIDAYRVEVGVPLVPALCQRLNTATEIIEKMASVYAEPKYDGLRIQIHIDKAGIVETDLSGQPTGRKPLYKAFTRNLEDVSDMFPELAAVVEQVQCQRCVLDSEAVGVELSTNKILPFQATITRKRKHEIAQSAQAVPIRFFVFDVMYIDQTELISLPLSQRKQRLLEVVPHNSSVVQVATYITTSDADELHRFHEEQLALGLEGAVMKQIDSEYRSGRKGWRWVKIKEHEGTSGKLSDTIDCVVMGYYRGRGKRTGFGVGAFLLGVVNEVDGELVVKTIAKLGTGLSDADFPVIKGLVDQHTATVAPKVYEVDKGLSPDVWIEPQVVLEIAADEITQSPLHSAGLSLRFPRLIRVRSDKNWQQATSITELQSISIAR
jgi:DNA ligase 1